MGKWKSNRTKGIGWDRECKGRWNKDKIGKQNENREEKIGWSRVW